MGDFEVRKIAPTDNNSIAAVIRSVMTEFGAVGAGFSIEDPEVDTMFEAYQGDHSIYYVVCAQGNVLGGAGVAPLAGGDAETCELKKMYFMPEARGLGAGRVLAELLLHDARKFGYSRVYIETLQRMGAANQLYRSLGFQPLPSCLGATGHGGCDTYYVLDFEPMEEIIIG